jgi:hypothetical protein
MKKDNWIVYLIIALTSTTTVLTLWDNTVIGLLRGVGFAVVLDGFIVYWESRGEVLTNAQQRKFANVMKWLGVVMLLAIAAAYAFVSLVPVDAPKSVDVFGVSFTSTVREFIHWVIVGAISLWVVLTLGVIMAMREIDPETKRTVELSKAHEAREQEEMRAYKTALNVTARTIGTEKALKLFRANLEAMEYKPVEIDRLVNEAEMEIKASRGEAIPVDAGVRSYSADTPTVDANFTKPSTPNTPRR